MPLGRRPWYASSCSGSPIERETMTDQLTADLTRVKDRRETVLITYRRGLDNYRVDLMSGSVPLRFICGGEPDERIAERWAAAIARPAGLSVSRVDVP